WSVARRRFPHERRALRTTDYGPIVSVRDNLQGGQGVFKCAAGLSALPDAFHEVGKFHSPGVILARVFPDRRFRWTHLGQHAEQRQPLDAVTASQAVDL